MLPSIRGSYLEFRIAVWDPLPRAFLFPKYASPLSLILIPYPSPLSIIRIHYPLSLLLIPPSPDPLSLLILIPYPSPLSIILRFPLFPVAMDPLPRAAGAALPGLFS